MKHSHQPVFIIVALTLLTAAAAQAAITTAFTYQGKLTDNGGIPQSGTIPMVFKLFDSSAGGAQIGASVPQDVTVQNGVFTVSLDFGAAAFNGDRRWLEVTVNGALISPRHEVLAAPYALFSAKPWETLGSAIVHNGPFVGINRSSPITGNEYFGIQTPTGAATYGGMYIATDNDTGKPFYGYKSGAAHSAWTYLDGANGDWKLYNGGDRLVVTDSGNVGIGVTSPTRRLQVESTGSAFYATSNSGQVGQFYAGPSSSALSLYAVTYGSSRAALFESHNANNNSAAVYILKNGGPALQVAGGVNAGTHDPDSTLSVTGGSDTSADGGGYIVAGSVAGTNVSIDNNEIMARSNGAVATLALNAEGGNVTLVQGGTGGVTVGTTVLPTGVKMAVDGKVLCEELEVQLSQDWPDYVFAENYDLMPLKELEEFVRAKKHLPNIPAASAVGTSVKVGETQTALLRKVEELTLYMVGLNKEMDTVRQENAQLKNRLARLETPGR